MFNLIPKKYSNQILLLDVGCGNGWVVKKHHPERVCELVG